MKKSPVPVLVLAALVLTLSCSREIADTGGGEDAVERGGIAIVFDLPGDDFASPEDLDRRNAIAAAVVEQGVGEVMSTGSGMGSMRIVVRMMPDASTATLMNIIRDIYPEARYRIEH